MIELGTVKAVHIQQESLKTGKGKDRHYSPDPILLVDKVEITSAGVWGHVNGKRIVDVHNTEHPRSRNMDNKNGLSFNFTGHYAAMQSQFGDHLTEGCAGENILIETERTVRLDELGSKVAIVKPDQQRIVLRNMMVAAPCREFSCFVRQAEVSGIELKQTLQFLDQGIRGFYAALEGEVENLTIEPGDRVFTLNN